MAQMYFTFGAMSSGKSITILKVRYNYEEQGKHTLLFTAGIDNRDGVGFVSSRIGLREDAISIFPQDNIHELIRKHTYTQDGEGTDISCILVDEAQFLTEEQVKAFSRVVDGWGVPVMAYGLKNDFQNNLFEGSKNLLLYADKIEEMKTICKYCNKKAIMNLRLSNNKPIYKGEQVQIGGNESYASVCRRHYYAPTIEERG